MKQVHKSYSLLSSNTFHIESTAQFFSEPSDSGELAELMEFRERNNLKWIVIGEGSNLLFRSDFKGLVIHPLTGGIEILDESSSELLVRVGSAENWDNFVAECVKNSWHGAENLSLIPGSVGSAPVQNIGAYGREVKDLIEYVEVYDTYTGENKVLSNQECEFGYRDSIFKYGEKQRYIVLYVVFNLLKKSDFLLDYGNVRTEFENQPKHDLITLRETIINIRKQKLPDYHSYGNAGSFFKNPVITENKFLDLQSRYPSIPFYPSGRGDVKVPAAWLIDQCGWKGRREGDVGCWPNQPLVIVNYGKATGEEIFQFSEKIKISVLDAFGIQLEREVMVIE